MAGGNDAGEDWTGIGVYPVDCLPIRSFIGISGSVGWNFEGVASRIVIGIPGNCFDPRYPEGSKGAEERRGRGARRWGAHAVGGGWFVVGVGRMGFSPEYIIARLFYSGKAEAE